jgi:hypothetical protein
MTMIITALVAFQHTSAYWIMLVFFGFYPVFSAIVWRLTTSVIYFTRKERLAEEKEADLYALPDPPPVVSMLIPTYCEEKVIESTLEGALAIDYPSFEVVVVDDGSTDRTVAMIPPYVESGRVRLIRKTVNEGKAMALNDALLCLNGDIVLTIDADAVVDPRILRHLVPHFSSARVAAVTGNPRVSNRRTLLSKIQLIEFTSIVGLLRRAQRVWGRIQTVSGVVVAFRKKALFDVGLFNPERYISEEAGMDWRWRFHPRWELYGTVMAGAQQEKGERQPDILCGTGGGPEDRTWPGFVGGGCLRLERPRAGGARIPPLWRPTSLADTALRRREGWTPPEARPADSPRRAGRGTPRYSRTSRGRFRRRG